MRYGSESNECTYAKNETVESPVDPMKEVNSIFDNLKVNPNHRKIFFAAGLGIFLDGYDLSIIAVMLLLLIPEWHLSATSIGQIGAAALAGAALGGIFGGLVADCYGRKVLYLVNVSIFLFASLLAGLSWDVASFVFFRFLLGIAIGMDYPLSSSYIVEFMPRLYRGSVLAWGFSLWMIGVIASAFVGFLLIRTGPDAWRLMAISGAIPALGIIWVRRTLPETPRWSITNGRFNDAVAVLNKFDTDSNSLGFKSLPIGSRNANPENSTRFPFFSRRWRRRTLLIVIPWMLADVSTFGFTVFSPFLLNSFGIRSYESVLVWDICFNLMGLAGIVFLALTTTHLGRIFPQKIGFALGAFFLGLFGLEAILGDPPSWILVFTLLGYMFINNFGPGTTTWFLPAELFPTELRASAHGLATACSRVAAAISVFFLPVVRQAIGIGWLMIVLASISLAGFWVTKEVGRGLEPGTRSLESISATDNMVS